LLVGGFDLLSVDLFFLKDDIIAFDLLELLLRLVGLLLLLLSLLLLFGLLLSLLLGLLFLFLGLLALLLSLLFILGLLVLLGDLSEGDVFDWLIGSELLNLFFRKVELITVLLIVSHLVLDLFIDLVVDTSLSNILLVRDGNKDDLLLIDSHLVLDLLIDFVVNAGLGNVLLVRDGNENDLLLIDSHLVLDLLIDLVVDTGLGDILLVGHVTQDHAQVHAGHDSLVLLRVVLLEGLLNIIKHIFVVDLLGEFLVLCNLVLHGREAGS
jgi:hypothetical protein